jgi:hypothetical protein
MLLKLKSVSSGLYRRQQQVLFLWKVFSSFWFFIINQLKLFFVCKPEMGKREFLRNREYAQLLYILKFVNLIKKLKYRVWLQILFLCLRVLSTDFLYLNKKKRKRKEEIKL